MKTAKLVLGIVSIVLGVLGLVWAFPAGLFACMADDPVSAIAIILSGFAGAVLLLAAGIIGTAGYQSAAASLVAGVFFLLAFLLFLPSFLLMFLFAALSLASAVVFFTGAGTQS